MQKNLHFFKSLNGLKSATLHKNIIKITLFIMNIFYYKTNLIHFRDTKLLRVGLKFTNVSFARVRQIYDNEKIEGWGEGEGVTSEKYVRKEGGSLEKVCMRTRGKGGSNFRNFSAYVLCE